MSSTGIEGTVSLRMLERQALWSVSRAADTLSLQFGGRHRTVTKRGAVRDVGDYALHIQCPCEVVSDGTAVSDIRGFIESRPPLKVVSVDDVDLGNIVLTFDDDVSLIVHPNLTSSDEQWRLLRPGRAAAHLVFAAGRLFTE